MSPPHAVRAVFLDRDGVLNQEVDRGDGNFGAPWRLEDFRLLPGVEEACERLRRAGWKLVVVTNQPDVRRGQLAWAAVQAMHEQLRQWLGVEEVRVCGHDDGDGCPCRKPRPGLLLAAAQELGLDLGASWMVGDRSKDVEAGAAAGCRTLRVGPGGQAADLSQAVTMILSQS